MSIPFALMHIGVSTRNVHSVPMRIRFAFSKPPPEVVSIRFGPLDWFRELVCDRKYEHVIRYEKPKTIKVNERR